MATQTCFTRVVVLLALSGCGRLALGQAAPFQSLAAARANAWMDSVRRLPPPPQVAAIRVRVLADTVLRHPSQFVCLTPRLAA